jgi:hypothetical protein
MAESRALEEFLFQDPFGDGAIEKVHWFQPMSLHAISIEGVSMEYYTGKVFCGMFISYYHLGQWRPTFESLDSVGRLAPDTFCCKYQSVDTIHERRMPRQQPNRKNFQFGE